MISQGTFELPSNCSCNTVGEAWDFGPRLVRADSLVPVRDASVDSIFQGRAIHILVKENRAKVQPTDQVEVKLVNFSKAEAECAKAPQKARRNSKDSPISTPAVTVTQEPHTIFKLRNKPLPVTSSVRNWAQGKGGQIARSLGWALQLPKDMHYFSSGSDKALAARLQCYSIAAVQLAYMMKDQLKDAAEETDKEKALNKAAEATAKDKDKAVKDAKERARVAEGAWALAKKKLMETEVKMGGMKLKLAETESMN
nr:hypothetical protein CFP56_44868 [Quercus suber]